MKKTKVTINKFKHIVPAAIFLGGVLAAFQASAVLAPDPSTLGQNGSVRWQTLPPWKIESKALDIAHTLDGKRVFILTETHQVEVYTTNGSKLGTIAVDAGVKNIDISPVGDKLYSINNDKGVFSTHSVAFRQIIDTAGAPTKGLNTAPVSIVLFTDFQCPYCKRLPPVLDEVLEKNKGKVKLYFKNLPLNSIHPFATDAALAAIAAQEQGKFWEYHDQLFSITQFEPNTFENLAEKLNLDMEQFKKDISSKTTRERLQSDLIAAQKAGVDGTPSVYVNGWPLGNRSAEGFQALIDDELRRMEKLEQPINNSEEKIEEKQ